MAELERDKGIGDVGKFKGLHRELVLCINNSHDALSLNGLPESIKPKRR
jgi:hypothetical protein